MNPITTTSPSSSIPPKQEEEFDYLREILVAPVYDVAIETPLHWGINLSHRLGELKPTPTTTVTSSSPLPPPSTVKVLYKREDLQPVFSFKIRGAYNKIRALSKEQKDRGIVAVSAGNHAQGVALSAQKLGIKATIVMPLNTPAIKWKNVERLGGHVVLSGNDFDDAKLEGQRLVDTEGYTNIPPYDDPYVIAGQGTAGVEILRQVSGQEDIEAIFCCMGGGGLVAGIASYVKRIKPHVKIFGVDTVDSYAMMHSLREGRPSLLPQVGLFADGAAVRIVGTETFRLASSLLDGVILVTNDDICAAIKDIFEDTRSIVEPAGALGVAGLKRWLSLTRKSSTNPFSTGKGQPQAEIVCHPGRRYHFYPDSNVLLSPELAQTYSSPHPVRYTHTDADQASYVAVLSGANMNFDRLRFVADRAELGLNKEALISVVIPESPGSFVKLHNAILPRAVTSFSYRYSDKSRGNILMGFSLLDPSNRDDEIAELFTKLRDEAGFIDPCDLSDNELAKSHTRFMVGGLSDVPNERVFRFEFPERPNALKTFLSKLNMGWNVSLFQYRNYGGDTGKIFVGIQIPPADDQALTTFLHELNYPWVEETNNPAYQLFFRAQ